MYIDNAANVLLYLGYNEQDFIVNIRNGVVTLDWLNTDPADQYYPDGPTEQQILDTYNSQAFQDWRAEHGGDPTLTTRRQIREALDTPTGKVVKALAQVMIDQGIIQATQAQVLTAVTNKINEGAVD